MLVVVTEYSGTTLNRMQFSEQLKLLRESASTIAPGTQIKSADVYLTNWKCSCLGHILIAAVDGPWSHYSRACSVGSQGEQVCSSRCSLPYLDCHFHPPRSEGPIGGMSDTTADTISSIGHLLGQGFPLPRHLFQRCATLWIFRALPQWIYMFLLVL